MLNVVGLGVPMPMLEVQDAREETVPILHGCNLEARETCVMTLSVDLKTIAEAVCLVHQRAKFLLFLRDSVAVLPELLQVFAQQGNVVCKQPQALVQDLALACEVGVRGNEHLDLALHKAPELLQLLLVPADVLLNLSLLRLPHGVDPVDARHGGLHFLFQGLEVLLHLVQLPDVDLPELLLGFPQVLLHLGPVTAQVLHRGHDLVHQPQPHRFDHRLELLLGALHVGLGPLLCGPELCFNVRHPVILSQILGFHISKPSEVVVLPDLDEALTGASSLQGAV
mmetsp:Transcript_92904/g.300446  ORF Transcript_92904/g.300446 Transcript_92904/m.300446 type:complete len:282 (+) Transcript_92904:812-1657(+)